MGGIDISIGKLAVYTAAAGIDPNRVIPVVLDVGTDQENLLEDPHYLGNRHPRVRGERYDAFIEQYVQAAATLFPNAVLHWEDFGADNARRIVERYRDRVCTFNDDMQGTGAVVLAATLAAIRAAGTRLRDQQVVLFGAGTAGIGIADQLCDAMARAGLPLSEATAHFWCLGRHGLLTADRAPSLRDFQRPYARPAAEIQGWNRDQQGAIGLAEVVRRVRPTMLIGASTVANAFTEPIVCEMAAHTERPIIFPLTNPTELSEAAPAELIPWTDGRGLIATGSPFAPVTYKGITHTIAQANNALIFPGLGLGTIVTRARRITDEMLAAAAEALAGLVDARQPGASLLPQVENLRSVSAAVAAAVARTAMAQDLARMRLVDVERAVREAMWEAAYRRVVACAPAAGSVATTKRPGIDP